MSSKKVTFTVLVGALLLVSMASMATAQTQQHPFSEIVPGGDDLEFEQQDATGVGMLDIHSGVTVEGDEISDSGNQIYLDTEGSTWSFVGGDVEGDVDALEIQEEGGVNVPDGDLNLGDGRITNLADPQNMDDAASRGYIESGDTLDWNELNISQDEIDAEDIDLAELSGGDGISGSNYDGSESINWNILWSDAGALEAGGNIADNQITDDEIDSISLSSVSDSGDLADQNSVGSGDIQSNSVRQTELDEGSINCLGDYC